MFAPPPTGMEQAVALLEHGPDLGGLSGAELGELLVEMQELRSRAELRAWQLAAAFDTAAGWADDGAVSCSSWLRHRTGIGGGEAATLVRSGRRLRSLPATEAAVEAGRLSSAKARVVTRTLTDPTLGSFADQETDLVDQLCELSVADCATVMRYFQQLNEPAPDEPEAVREAHLSRTFDGTYALSGTLDAEGGATLGTALQALIDESYRNDRDAASTPIARRRADALVELARRAMAADPATATPARPSITLTVALELLLDDDPADDPTGGVGPPGGPLLPVASVIERALTRRSGPYELAATDLTPGARRRLACDATVARLLLGPGSVPLDLGRATRTASPAQWRALATRDRGCTWPGCDRPPGWTQAHHIVFWEHGGPTDIENLRCSVATIITPSTTAGSASPAAPTAGSPTPAPTAPRSPERAGGDAAPARLRGARAMWPRWDGAAAARVSASSRLTQDPPSDSEQRGLPRLAGAVDDTTR